MKPCSEAVQHLQHHLGLLVGIHCLSLPLLPALTAAGGLLQLLCLGCLLGGPGGGLWVSLGVGLGLLSSQLKLLELVGQLGLCGELPLVL